MVSARQTVSQFPQKNSIRKKFCVCVCILPLTEAGAASPAQDQASAKTGKPARLVPIFPRQSELCHGIQCSIQEWKSVLRITSPSMILPLMTLPLMISLPITSPDITSPSSTPLPDESCFLISRVLHHQYPHAPNPATSTITSNRIENIRDRATRAVVATTPVILRSKP